MIERQDIISRRLGDRKRRKEEEEQRLAAAAKAAADAAAKREVEAAAKAKVQGRKTYVVRSGDSLSKIAKAELGNAHRWREIYELNKAVIGDNPDLIQPGQKYVLPD